MKRVTVTLPDDLTENIAKYRDAQEVLRPALSAVLQAALRQYWASEDFCAWAEP